SARPGRARARHHRRPAKDPGSRNAYALATVPTPVARRRPNTTDGTHPRLQCPGRGVYRTASRLQPVRITVPAAQPNTRSAMHPELSLFAAQQRIADV